MKLRTLNKIYESLDLISLDDEDDGFSKSSTASELNRVSHNDPIYKFLQTYIIEQKPLNTMSEDDKNLIKMMNEAGINHNLYVCVYPETVDDLMSYLDLGVKIFGPDGWYNWIGTSKMTSLTNVFYRVNEYRHVDHKWNGNITAWDISNVVNMNNTFAGCYAFNRDLSQWNFSKVKYMSRCFNGCNQKFKQQMKSLIDVSKLKTRFNIF